MRARICFLILLAVGASAANAQSGNPARPCYSALAEDARFAPIRDKVALGPDIDRGAQRMGKIAERASEQEKPILATWRDAREACHQKELPYYASRDSEIGALARRHFAAVQSLIGELQGGKLTYGEFATRRSALDEKVTRDIEAVRKSILPPKPVSPMPTK